MRNPGIAKEYFQLVKLGCQWTLEVRTFMAAVIAKKLGATPNRLPLMTDEQLWQSYKTAVGVGDVAAIQGTILALRDYAHHLSQGEITALMLGVNLDTPRLPQGETVGELTNGAMPDAPEIERLLWGGLFMMLGYDMLKRLGHPTIIDL